MPPSYTDRFLGGRKADKVEGLVAFAESRGHTLLELALSWLAARPQVASIITGATRPRADRGERQGGRLEAQRRGLAEIDRITLAA